jgi:hypothetical protein
VIVVVNGAVQPNLNVWFSNSSLLQPGCFHEISNFCCGDVCGDG